MSSVLKQLADEVGASERTLRRGVGSGLIRAQRPSSRRLLIPAEETTWVRRHWALIARLRAALRTEPNVELAVLFGSHASGDDVAGASDVDLLVALRSASPGVLEALRLRLNRQLPVEVQLVPLEAVRRNPRLLSEILRDGRPLVDREQAWPGLQTQAGRAQAQANQLGGELREGAHAALVYFQELAAAHARASAAAGS